MHSSNNKFRARMDNYSNKCGNHFVNPDDICSSYSVVRETLKGKGTSVNIPLPNTGGEIMRIFTWGITASINDNILTVSNNTLAKNQYASLVINYPENPRVPCTLVSVLVDPE